MTGRLASYPAAVTALTVVNFTFLRQAALWPTRLGSPLIALWVAYYKRRFARPRAHEAAAA